MSKHTPGPWKIEEQRFPPGEKITSSERNICFFPDSGFGQGLEGAANANLIAAAPELLEAAKFALAQLKPEQTEAISLLKGAIGKAEGKK